MSDLLIEQFCQMLAEHLEETSSVSKPESIAFLQSVIQADARLRKVFEDRMVQFNQGNAVGFQTWLESGARGFFGTNYVVHDPTVLQEGMKILLDELARRPVGTPSNLPLSGVAKFVGREEKLTEVHEKLQAGSTVAVTSVSGMGGVGKTELALQYAYQYLQANTYPGGLCWINVRAQDVGLGLLEFARTRLGLPEPPDNQETLLEKVQWVCQRWQGEPILVVLDDVTDYEAVNPYLNLLDPRFRVLITTRLKLNDTKELELGVLTESASLELLRVLVRDPHRIDSQLADAQRLCEWLGCLPLGLELVGRYLARREDLSLVEMLERLEAKKLAAQALVQAKQMTAQLGVAAAFQLTWDDEQFPNEAKMLCGLLSVFALAPIPWHLVEKCLPDWDKEDLETCQVDHLLGRSLLSRVGKGLYQLHQLIREFFVAKREQMAGTGEMKKSFCQVMVQEADAIPQVTPTLAQIQQATPIIPHLVEAATNLTNWLADTDLVMPFLGISRFHHAKGTYTQALPWLEQCCVVAEARLGTNHPDVASTLNDLAHLYYVQGRYSEAEPLYKRAVSIDEQQLGKDHSNVATSLNNLAMLYQAQGRYSEAEPLYQRSMAIWEKQLSKDHPTVAKSLNNLASFYYIQGRYSEAEPLYQRSLSIREQQLGKDHPDVATTLSNLGALYHSQERYSEAEPLLQRTLAIWEQQLGSDHPRIATILNNLGQLYRAQRKGMANPFREPENYSSAAEPIYQRALAILEEKLGNDHPNIAPVLNNLAELYQTQRRYSEAEKLQQRMLFILEKQLGQDHPDVALSLNNLSGIYIEQGRYSEAEQILQRSHSILTNVLGENNPLTQGSRDNFWTLVQKAVSAGRVEELSDHPHIATQLNNLAEAYRQKERYNEAEPLHKRALSIREQQLGIDHPHVAQSLNNLALLYQSQGRSIEAEPLYQRLLSMREQLLSSNHSDAEMILNNLECLYQSQDRYVKVAQNFYDVATLHEEQGQYSFAESCYQQSLVAREQWLGRDHPDVALSLNSLAALYYSQERYVEAEPLYIRAITILVNQLGANHPNTQICKQNFLNLLNQVFALGQTTQLSDHSLTQAVLHQLRTGNSNA